MLKLLTRTLFILKFRQNFYLRVRPLMRRFEIDAIPLFRVVILLFLLWHFRRTFPSVDGIGSCILILHVVFSLNLFLLLKQLLFLKMIGFKYFEKLLLIFLVLNMKVIVAAYPMVDSCLSLGIAFVLFTNRAHTFEKLLPRVILHRESNTGVIVCWGLASFAGFQSIIKFVGLIL